MFFFFLAPEGPPRDLLVRQLNSSSCLVKWSEPDVRQRNGIITGYQVINNTCEINYEKNLIDSFNFLDLCFYGRFI